jgi:alginate O-acetyltransferase complex protein AlgI
MHVLMRGRTLLLVMIGWVFFRAPDLGRALGVLKAMFVPDSFGLELTTNVALTKERLVVMLLASLVVLLPRDFVFGRVLDTGRDGFARAARLIVPIVGIPYAAMLVAAGTFSPFLYYQF